MKFKTMWTKKPTPGKVYDKVDKVDRVNCLDPKKQLEEVIRTGEIYSLAALQQLPYDVDDINALDDIDMKNLSTLGLVRKLSSDFSNRHVCKKITEDALGESLRERFRRKVKEDFSKAEHAKQERETILKKAAEYAAEEIKNEDKNA